MEYFSTPTLSGLIQQLTHLAQFGANVLVVEGEKGAGKSALLSQLFENFKALESKNLIFHVTRLEPSAELGLEASVDLLAHGLSMYSEAEGPVGEKLAEIRSYSQNLLREKKLSLVLIDDVQRFSDEAIGAMLSLAIGLGESAYGLRFIMFAEPGMAERIDAIGLHELTVYDFALPGFSSQELERFLDAKGVLEGYEQKIAHLWNRSHGFPGPALDLIEALSEKASTQDFVRDVSRMPILHIGMLAGLIAALILVFLYRGESEPEPPSTIVSEPLLPEPLHTTNSIVDEPKRNESPDEELSEALQPANLEESPVVQAPTDSSAPELSAEPPSTNSEPELPSQQASSVPSGESAVGEAQVGNSDSNQGTESQAVPEERAPTRFEKNEEELLEAASSGYMLQLLAASQVDSLLGYIEEQANAEDLKLYRRYRQGQPPLYIVVTGPYSSRQAATSAISSLPEQQRKAGPWPKPLSAIKQEILEFRDISR